MGEARRRTKEQQAWLHTLSFHERIVFDVSRAVYERIVKPLKATGMCYRLAFFLTAYLKREHGIDAPPIVGYVNDGTSAILISHAWVEFEGKKTDLSLTITEHPDVQLPGPLLILDRELTRARALYTYHLDRGPTALRAVEELMNDPRYREMVRHKETEHARMTAMAKDMQMILAYLDAAPDGMRYAVWAQRVRGVSPGAKIAQ